MVVGVGDDPVFLAEDAGQFLGAITGAPECAQFGITEASAVETASVEGLVGLVERTVTLENGKQFRVLVAEVASN